MTQFTITQCIRFWLLLTSVQFIPKAPLCFPGKPLPLQSFSPEKRLQMSDRSWWALSGEAHKQDLSVESAESTQEMGPSPEPPAVCSCDWVQQLKLPALWGFSWKHSLHTLENGWPKHWCSSAPTAFFLQEAPELLSTSQSQDFGVYVRLESCSALLVGCCLNQEGIEFLHRGQWQGLAPAPVSDLPGAVGISWEWPKVCPVPAGTGAERNVPWHRWEWHMPQEGFWTLPRWKGRVSWPPCKHSTLKSTFRWLCQEEVAQSDVFTLD